MVILGRGRRRPRRQVLADSNLHRLAAGEVPHATISIDGGDRGSILDDARVWIRVDLAVAHEPGVTGGIARSVAEHAPQIAARQIVGQFRRSAHPTVQPGGRGRQ